MKNYKYIALFLLSIGFISCEDSGDFEAIAEEAVEVVSLNTNGLDLSKYVSLGASFTAGFTDNALFAAAQENSFPNILATKFKVAGGGDFNQPIMIDSDGKPSNIGGLLLGGNVIQGPRLYFDLAAGAPVPIAATPNTEVTTSVSGNLNNFGVPGAKSFHLLAPGYGNVAGVALGLANPYFARMASSPTATVIGDAMAQSPTFFTLSEIGGNDVLGYALAGGAGVDQSPTATNPTGNLDPSTYGSSDITNPLVFNQVFTGMVSTLTSGGAKGVIANVPYITSLAHFTTVPYNPIPLIPTQAAQINGAYAAYNGGLQQLLDAKNAGLLPAPVMQLLTNFDQAEVDKRKISFAAGQNAAVMVDENLTDLTLIDPRLVSMRQTTSNDLLVLTSSSVIGTLADPTNPASAIGIGVPLADRWVISPEEQMAIKTATDAYNTIIEGVAASNPNVAMVDFKGVLQEASMGIVYDDYTMTTSLVTGGLISLDGVHLTARGYALMANKILAAMDAKFGSNFTTATNGLAKAGNYPTNYNPALR